MHRKPRGFRNHYRSNMPWTEVAIKDTRSIFNDLLAFFRNGGSLPAIVVFPDYPSKKTTLFKIARRLRFRITNKRLKRPRLVIWFHDTTNASSALLEQHYPQQRVLNAGCTDISKTTVDRIHQAIFGYNTFIDPKTHHGQAVEKSDINALHDGSIVRCPLNTPKANAVYQVVIDNSTGSEFLDYRVPVIGHAIPLVYAKYKHEAVRFTNDVHRSELLEVNAIFSPEEQAHIIRFTQAMGADFCELDVLRDNASGKIYVIDVNKTPYGPPKGLGKRNHLRAISRLSDAFRQAFLNV
jgi:hypothetical protein